MAKVNVDLGAKVVDGLVAIEPINVPALFNEESNMRQIIDIVKAEVAKHTPDLTTAKGRAAIKSLAYTVSKSKTLLENLGKDLTVDLKAKVGIIDGIRKIARDELDALRDEVKAPVEEWEQNEERRVADVQLVLSTFSNIFNTTYDSTDHAKEARRFILDTEVGDEMAEFKEQAEKMKVLALEHLDGVIDNLIKTKADLAELNQLRKEKEERESAEAEEKRISDQKIADELAEEKRLAREEHIRREEQEKAEQESLDQQAEFEKEKERLIQEERDRVQKVEDDRVETERIEQEKAEKKAAGKKHQAKVNRVAAEVLAGVMNEVATGTVEENKTAAKALVIAIAQGRIPCVKIEY